MDALLKCQACEQQFDTTDREPKILPCSDLICLQCLVEHSRKQVLPSFFFTCLQCAKTHTVSKLDEMPTSKTTVYLLKQAEQTGESVNSMSNVQSKIEPALKTALEQLNKDLKLARFDIQIHYDDAINDVDIRTETLINSLNTARLQMQEKLNQNRTKSIDQFNLEIEKLNAINFDVSTPKTTALVLNQLNKSEQSLATINRSLSYFSDNTLKPFDNSLLGHIVNKSMDKNFTKIKNLKSILAEEAANKPLIVTLNIKDSCVDNAIRSNVIPLSVDRICKVYFTTSRSVYLEIYDSAGNLHNSLMAYENLSSFPISCGFGKYIVLTFTSKSSFSSHFESNSSFVLLFDTNLRLVKKIKMFSSVESIYMNEKYICLFYAHRSSTCCTLYDYQLNEVESLGQQADIDKPFYMEKSTLSYKDQASMALKNNPRIFGITEEFLYLFNVDKMTIMCRLSGLITTQVKISGDMPYFLLDTQSNIIQVNSLSKRIAVINYDFDYSVHNVFSDNLEDLYLTADNNLAFVDRNKEKVFFV
jgi:hypothetical protein